MTTSTSTSRTALLVLLAAVLALTLAPAAPSAAQELPTDPTPPADSGDPVALALSWSALIPDGTIDTVLLGTTRSFADSLAAGGLQSADSRRVLLLHDEGASLDGRVADEIARLGADQVVILGGPVAISDEVEAALDADYDITRLFGDGRRDTALAIAGEFFTNPTHLVLVRADGDADVPTRGFIDAIAAGSLSKGHGAPVLLNSTSRLDDQVRGYISANPIERVFIMGGTSAISRDVEREIRDLDAEIISRRVGGDTRFGTAGLAELALPLASADVGILVDGTNDLAWASGLPGTFHGDHLLLTAGDDAPAATVSTVLNNFNLDPKLVCGPLVNAEACAEARAAESATGGEARAVVRSTLDAFQLDEQPAPTAYGRASLLVGDDFACLSIFVSRLSGPTSAVTLHEGPRGQDGPVLHEFDRDTYISDSDSCVTGISSDLAADLAADPRGHHLIAATADNPDGEIRGQTFPRDEDDLFEPMQGSDVVPAGTGRDGGAASFELERADDDFACYEASVLFNDDVTSVTIHEAAEGQNGPVVLDLQRPAGPGDYRRCVEASPAILDAIIADRAGHYVLTSTEEFPDGAYRSQLE